MRAADCLTSAEHCEEHVICINHSKFASLSLPMFVSKLLKSPSHELGKRVMLHVLYRRHISPSPSVQTGSRGMGRRPIRSGGYRKSPPPKRHTPPCLRGSWSGSPRHNNVGSSSSIRHRPFSDNLAFCRFVCRLSALQKLCSSPKYQHPMTFGPFYLVSTAPGRNLPR
jgi:hypothetical protein